ncbi:MAG: class III signal peptide-containing protein [Bacteriovoracaceae bacterium]|nr:class III signal peptide-containing protein [Bacteriovoracaceae bacterium]
MKDEKGQTSVEYILLLAVMISVSIAFFKKVDGYVVSNPDSMVNRYLSGFGNILGSSSGTNGVSGSYKTFRLPR